MKKIPFFGSGGLLQLIARLEYHAEAAVILIIIATWVLLIVKTLRREAV